MSITGTRTCVDLDLTRDEARWIAVSAARLDRRPFRRRANADDVLDMVRYLRIVQPVSYTHLTLPTICSV